MKKNNAYAYLRVSGKGQIAGSGFDRQLKEIKRYCSGSGYKLVKVYREQVSGTKCEKRRPEMELMVADILSDDCRTIIVEDLSRLAREYRVQENIIIYLASKKIDLISANTGENITKAIASDPMRKALVQVQGIFSELDKSMLVKKLRKAREKIRQEEGRCEGAKPYGQLEGEAEILKYIKRLRRKPKNSCRKRRTYQSIADQLNNKEIKPRRGENWTSSLVYNVLKPNNGRKKL